MDKSKFLNANRPVDNVKKNKNNWKCGEKDGVHF